MMCYFYYHKSSFFYFLYLYILNDNLIGQLMPRF